MWRRHMISSAASFAGRDGKASTHSYPTVHLFTTHTTHWPERCPMQCLILAIKVSHAMAHCRSTLGTWWAPLCATERRWRTSAASQTTWRAGGGRASKRGRWWVPVCQCACSDTFCGDVANPAYPAFMGFDRKHALRRCVDIPSTASD